MIFNSLDLTISKTEMYIHKDAGLISQKAKAISNRLGIIDNALYAGHTTMTNYLYVDCPVDKMVNVLVTYDVLYFLDDFFGEDTNTGQSPDFYKILDLWKGEKRHHSKQHLVETLYESIAYISSLLKADSSASFFNKYTNSVVEHLSYALTKKDYKTVDEYTAIRLMTSGMYPVIDLIEYVHNICLSDALINTKELAIIELRESCALIGALSNDLFSYAKEKHSAYNLINAYLITKKASNYNEAVLKSITHVNTIHSVFELTLKKAKQQLEYLQPGDRLTVATYYKALEVIVAASYHWQRSTNRYTHSENVFEDMRAYV